MRRRNRWGISILALLLMATFAGPLPGHAAEPPSLAIGSGNTSGVYYAAAAALVKVVNRDSARTGLQLVNQASQGSEQNINDVLDGKVALGLAQADMLDKAVHGRGPWQGRPQAALRAVLALHDEALTLVAAEDAEIVGPADFKGKRINIGAPGSGDNENTRKIFELAGINPEELELREEIAAIASDLLQEGEIDIYVYTVGHPNLSVREATSGKRKARLLQLPPEMIAHFEAARPYLHAVTIPVDQYPGLESREPVRTIGEKAVLFARADLDETAVAQLVREVLAKFDLFRRQHLALSVLTKAELAAAPVLTLHPGAQVALREAGLLK